MPNATASSTRQVTGKFDAERTFGIEIEAYNVETAVLKNALVAAGIPTVVRAGADHTDSRTHWKITSDGSIRGEMSFELVSPILKGENGLDQIRTVCQVLNTLDAKVNRSTGLHVHHDAADLSVENLKALLTLWWKYEDVILFFVAPSRRNNYFALPSVPRGNGCAFNYDHSGSQSIEDAWKAALDGIRRKEDFYNFQNGRYSMVNLYAMQRHNTIEYRVHQGTTNANKIISWVVFTQWLITRTKACGAKVTTRMIGQWAEDSRFFFRAIGWINTNCPLTLAAKEHLRKRFNDFKHGGTDETEHGEMGRPMSPRPH